ncbi:MAG: AsmA-like C-terminal region-containing protein, partial [Brachymonas sp.]|nr:AsmA-like C-terminal region-containing protein [Brachymonas sp.]
ASLVRQPLDLDALVQPKIDLGAAALLTTAINPIIGIGSYFAQLVLSKSLSEMATQVYQVSGPMHQPEVEKLQGQTARITAQRVLQHHGQPLDYNFMWDWYPVTGRRTNREAATPEVVATPSSGLASAAQPAASSTMP